MTYADYHGERPMSFVCRGFPQQRGDAALRQQRTPRRRPPASKRSRLREDARDIIRDAVGADTRKDVVIFCRVRSHGRDPANHRCDESLPTGRPRLSISTPRADRRQGPAGRFHRALRTPFPTNCPWRESIADVVVIPEDADGHIDQEHLERKLQLYAGRPLKIGSFSAASNVTGIGSDTRNIAALLHRYGALSFWDFAAAAPYVQIDMNMRDDEADGDLVYKDAVFLSPHKFIGGPGTPGVLVAKRNLFKNRVPSVPGGGTVSYVNELEHRYIDDPEIREEGGTPAILESIRAGLVFQLKEAVGVPAIRARERGFIDRAIERWSANPNIEILGNRNAWRLSIVSFVVRYDDTRYLHPQFRRRAP